MGGLNSQRHRGLAVLGTPALHTAALASICLQLTLGEVHVEGDVPHADGGGLPRRCHRQRGQDQDGEGAHSGSKAERKQAAGGRTRSTQHGTPLRPPAAPGTQGVANALRRTAIGDHSAFIRSTRVHLGCGPPHAPGEGGGAPPALAGLPPSSRNVQPSRLVDCTPYV